MRTYLGSVFPLFHGAGTKPALCGQIRLDIKKIIIPFIISCFMEVGDNSSIAKMRINVLILHSTNSSTIK